MTLPSGTSDLQNFEGINHFRPDSSDQWGDPAQISHELLQKLDMLRDRVNAPIHVTSGYRTQAKYGIVHSQHMLGKAVDVVCPDVPLSKFYAMAQACSFQGLGVYPSWIWNNQKVGGLHLDVRDPPVARWMGIPDPVVGEKYIALNQENLMKYGVII